MGYCGVEVRGYKKRRRQGGGVVVRCGWWKWRSGDGVRIAVHVGGERMGVVPGGAVGVVS